jgi:hypothetical protein
MSRKWKIMIGAAVALAVVGCVGLPIVGTALFRGRLHEARLGACSPQMGSGRGSALVGGEADGR